jgi:hypothetical protein
MFKDWDNGMEGDVYIFVHPSYDYGHFSKNLPLSNISLTHALKSSLPLHVCDCQVHGRLRCLGPQQRLRSRFALGNILRYTLNFVVRE